MLEIKNLHTAIDGNEILRGIDLEVNKGQIHAIMGPNGSGKSTLANVLAGKDDYEVIEGSITYQGEDLLEMEPEDRARNGMFLAFQYPVEIPGVSNSYLLKTALNEIRKHQGMEEIDAADFLALIKDKLNSVDMDPGFMSRPVNQGFSGGEKKRNEILQMSVLDPTLSVLDETDSGLDIDALKIVANGVNRLRRDDNAFLIVTHYQRLLQYIVPDYVHVLYRGKIVKSGDKELAFELEEKGYDWLKNNGRES
ncbi:MAG: Fe-S cluster assembly ATPase SufC [Caldithrix sp.]|nr:Fe-S cluster assembly ATPase SufC [Caldithrix sp.]